jgi:arylsulfatase A-like enzyme
VSKQPHGGRGRAFLWCVGSVAAVWAVAALWLVPALIGQAYRGESLPALNAVVSGRDVHPLSDYLELWYSVAFRTTLALAAAATVVWVVLRWPDRVRAIAGLLFREPAVPVGRGLLLAAALGFVSGFLEFATSKIRFLTDGEFVHGSNPDTLWIAPLLLPLAFGVLFAPLALLGAAVRRSINVGAIVALLGFFGWMGIIKTARLGIHPAATAVLAVGLALVSARALLRAPVATTRGLRGGVLSATAVLLLVAIGMNGGRWLREQRLLGRLPAAAADAPNVLLIILDTVRAASLGLHGYDRPTTPRLEQFARRGIVFASAFAPSSWTLPSHATAFTGRQPQEHGVAWHTPLDHRYPTLAEALAAQGYATAGFVANLSYTTRASGLARGFAHYEDYGLSPVVIADGTWLTRRVAIWFTRRYVGGGWMVRKHAPEVSAAFLDWVDRERRAPFFAFLNYFDAHSPYRRRAQFIDRFPARAGADDVVAAEGGREPRPERLRDWLDRYDSSIAYLDHELGLLFDALARRGLLDNTLIVVTSDHGEHFGERELTHHGNSLYTPLLHVPLVLVPPASSGIAGVPGRREEVVSLRDLPATILDLVDANGSFDLPGRSWLAPRSADHAVLSAVSPEADEEDGPLGRGESVSLVVGSHQYIRKGSGAEELYDLEADPEQAVDLSAHPSSALRLRELRRRLDEVLVAAAAAARTGGQRD